MIVWCAVAATTAPGPTEEYLDLPEGVIHVALPPGKMKMEYTIKKEKPLLRVSAGKAVIEARTIFLGDGKAATQFEATKEGIHWPSAKGEKGFVIDGEWTNEPGSTIGATAENYITVDQLKSGSVYVTTPSIKFEFKPAAKPKP
jgi:hypothetical protein